MSKESATTRMACIMAELVGIIDEIGFAAARESISIRETDAEDYTGQPDWRGVFGAGIRHAIDVAEDADDCDDTCHICIAWPHDGPWGVNSGDFGQCARHALNTPQVTK